MNEKYNTWLSGFNLANVIITNAADLKSVDTACYIDTAGVSHSLTATYDDTASTLSIAAQAAFMNIERIHYLQKGVDFNLCDPSTDFYTTDKIPELTGPTATMLLTSTTAAAKPITMTFTKLTDPSLP